MAETNIRTVRIVRIVRMSSVFLPDLLVFSSERLGDLSVAGGRDAVVVVVADLDVVEPGFTRSSSNVRWVIGETGLQMLRLMVVSTVWPIVGSMEASRVAVLSPKDISFSLWSRHKAGSSLVKKEWGRSSEWMRASSQLIFFSSPPITPKNLLKAGRGGGPLRKVLEKENFEKNASDLETNYTSHPIRKQMRNCKNCGIVLPQIAD